MAAQGEEDPAEDGEDPDIHELFCHYNSIYFGGELGACVVSWDTNRTTKYTGICRYEEEGYCEIHLSNLLKHRRGADLKSALLHEMIHAYLWVKKQNNDHRDHGRSFQELVDKIVSGSIDDLQRPIDGYSITSSHDFHEEIASHKIYQWICGVCGSLFEKSMDRQPSDSDCTEKVKRDESCRSSFCQWHSHKLLCSGNYKKKESSFRCDDTKETAEAEVNEDQPKVCTNEPRGHQEAHKDSQDIDNVAVRSVKYNGSSEEPIPSTSQTVVDEHKLGRGSNKSDSKKSKTGTNSFPDACDENRCLGCKEPSPDSREEHKLDESVCLEGNKEEEKKSIIRRSKAKLHPAVGGKDLPDTSKSRKLKSRVTNENVNGSNSHSTNVRSRRNPKRKKREELDLTTFLHPVPGKARRSVRVASRKKLKYTEADSDEYSEFIIDHLECSNDYSILIGWSDWHADGEDEMEDTEPLINKRTERRKKQKLLINKKEVPRNGRSVPCGSSSCATVKQRKDRPSDESNSPSTINPCKQNTRTFPEDEKLHVVTEAASMDLKFKSSESLKEICCDIEISEAKSPPSTCPANDKLVLPTNCASVCDSIPCVVDTPEDASIPSDSLDQNEIVEISDG